MATLLALLPACHRDAATTPEAATSVVPSASAGAAEIVDAARSDRAADGTDGENEATAPELPAEATLVPFERISTIAEATPAGYVLDGDVSEWTGPADAVLSHVDGHARLWLALTERGLVVAGDVDARRGDVSLNKVRVDLAFVAPTLPPIAFVNHLSGEVVDEKWCHEVARESFGGGSGPPTAEEQAQCLAWLKDCEERRARVATRFVRTLRLDLATGRVTGAPGATASVRREEASTRATFELELPSTSFPETAEMPLRTVRIAAGLASDRPTGEAGATAKPAWSVVVRKAELRLHHTPEIVERIVLHAREQTEELLRVAVSYVPAPTSRRVSYFFNRGEAGQWAPYAPSPEIGELEVSRGRNLFTIRSCAAGAGDGGAPCANGGDIEVWAHPVWFDDTFGLRHPQVVLVSRRHGGAYIDAGSFSSYDPYKLVRRAPGVHVLSVYQGPAGPYGSGPSGAMPGYAFEVATMDTDGHFGKTEPMDLRIWRDHVIGVEGLAGFEQEDSLVTGELWIDPALKFFGLRGTLLVAGDGGDDFAARERAFEAGYRYDPHDGRYLKFGRVGPVPDAGVP